MDMAMVMDMDMAMEDTVTTDIMARGLLSQLPLLSHLLLLSLDMDMAMDMSDMATVVMDTMDIMVKDPLKLSQDMAMDMVMDMDMDMAMDMVDTDTTDIMVRGPLMPYMAMVDMDMVI